MTTTRFEENDTLQSQNDDFDMDEMSISPTNGNTTDFDISEFYIPQGVDESGITAEKILTRLPIRKTGKAEFVRSHPSLEYRRELYLYEDKDGDGTFYVVHPRLVPEIAIFVSQYLLVLCVNNYDVPFFFPVNLSTSKAMTKFRENALEFVERSQTRWMRRTWNSAINEHELFGARNMEKEPVFPEGTIEELLKLAAKGGMIKSTDHPIYKKLLGEM